MPHEQNQTRKSVVAYPDREPDIITSTTMTPVTSHAPKAFALPGVEDIVSIDSHFRSKIDGRFLTLRGVCFGPVAKQAPFLPLRALEDWKQFETYADLLLASGFLTLRLPFSWAALEPMAYLDRPHYDERYLDNFFKVASLFTAKGFLVFIDLHQDLIQPAYGGNGFPSWVIEDGIVPKQYLEDTPWWGLNYVYNTGLRKTFTQFWLNDLTNTSNDPPLVHFAVRDRYIAALECLAERAANDERIIGVEIFNEPHPATLDEKEFESERLPRFYREALAAIRRHSQNLYAFIAPQSDWNVNLRSDKQYHSLLAMNGSEDPRLVYAFHYYDSILTGMHGLSFHPHKKEEYLDAMEFGSNEARRRGLVPFATEFGTRQNWRSSVVRRHMSWHFEAAERSVLNATYWNVNLYNTPKAHDGFMREDFSLIGADLKPRNFAIAVRPYVIAGSAEPVSMHFAERTRIFRLLLKGTPVSEPTVIYVPCFASHPLAYSQYPEGFEVFVNSDSSTAAFLKSHDQLHVRLASTQQEHEIVIKPLESPQTFDGLFSILRVTNPERG